MAKRTTQAKWEERLDRWRESGQSADEFAAREGVKPAALKWWRWKLGAGEKSRGTSSAASFVEVREVAKAASPVGAPRPGSAPRYEVVLRNGRVVRIAEGFSDDELARLLATAERAQ